MPLANLRHGNAPYFALYASMEASLQEASSPNDLTRTPWRRRGDASKTKSAVSLPLTEFYLESRFFAGPRAATHVEPRCALCESTLCTIRCHSCARYEPSGGGYYCAACFTIRHPPHRAPHAWGPAAHGEDLNDAARRRQARVELDQLGDDITKLAAALKRPSDALRHLDEDYRADDMIKAAHRKHQDLAVHVTRLQRALRAPALVRVTDGPPSTRLPTHKLPPLIARDDLFSFTSWELNPEHAAAALFQRTWRRYCARCRLAALVAQRYHKLLDDETGCYYFLDLRTMTSSWEPPGVLWHRSSHRVPPSADLTRAAALILTPRSHERRFGPVDHGE